MAKRAASLALLALILMQGICMADAEEYFSWSGEFPATPQLEYHAYASAPQALDGDALAEAIWPGMEWDISETDDGCIYILEAADNSARGCREFINVELGSAFYSQSRTEFPDVATIGGPDAAYEQAYEFVSSLLSQDALAHPLPVYPVWDEDGNALDNCYDVIWLQEIEPGVYADSPLVSAVCYPGYTDYVGYNPKTWRPIEGADAQDYISAAQALNSLNYAVLNIDPAHTCTNFDDPDDEIALIYPVMTSKFSESGQATLAWAFLIQDARLGYTRTVLVDAVSGDVFDDHDGRLPGSATD